VVVAVLIVFSFSTGFGIDSLLDRSLRHPTIVGALLRQCYLRDGAAIRTSPASDRALAPDETVPLYLKKR
jgi:hypothetical protein